MKGENCKVVDIRVFTKESRSVGVWGERGEFFFFHFQIFLLARSAKETRISRLPPFSPFASVFALRFSDLQLFVFGFPFSCALEGGSGSWVSDYCIRSTATTAWHLFYPVYPLPLLPCYCYLFSTSEVRSQKSEARFVAHPFILLTRSLYICWPFLFQIHTIFI